MVCNECVHLLRTIEIAIDALLKRRKLEQLEFNGQNHVNVKVEQRAFGENCWREETLGRKGEEAEENGPLEEENWNHWKEEHENVNWVDERMGGQEEVDDEAEDVEDNEEDPKNQADKSITINVTEKSDGSVPSRVKFVIDKGRNQKKRETWEDSDEEDQILKVDLKCLCTRVDNG